MSAKLDFRAVRLAAILGLCLLVVAGCALSVAPRWDANTPRNGAGEPVDARTGITLPGVFQGGV